MLFHWYRLFTLEAINQYQIKLITEYFYSKLMSLIKILYKFLRNENNRIYNFILLFKNMFRTVRNSFCDLFQSQVDHILPPEFKRLQNQTDPL